MVIFGKYSWHAGVMNSLFHYVENNYINYRIIRKWDVIDQLQVVWKFKINFEIGKNCPKKILNYIKENKYIET